MLILAVETSCDETSVSIVKNGKEVLSNIIYSQISTHKEYGGVVPEIASRMHCENITIVFEEALKVSNVTPKDIDLVAVTKEPGLIGSLFVGINAARAFALSHDIKLVEVNHLVGHIYANNIEQDIKFPCIALVVSGGHTSLIYMKEHMNFEILGETMDDAVGEAYDKVARVCGFPYPGGPYVDKAAAQGKPTYDLPRPYLEKDLLDFSFSGLKSAVINLVHNKKQKNEEVAANDLCASFQEAVLDVIMKKVEIATTKFNTNNLLIAGGVSANRGLRARLSDSTYDVLIPKFEYCTDNAAMIAAAAYCIK